MTDSRSEATNFAKEQEKNLIKTVGRFDTIFIVMSAVLSIEVIAATASFGGEAFTWTLVLAVFFLVPYGLIFAETSSTFTGEGGIYLWVRRAFGRRVAALASILSWITTPVWVGGSMAFLAAATWHNFITPLPSGTFYDYVFKFVFIAITVTAAIASMKYAKWFPSLGAILKVAFLVMFIVTTIIYGISEGYQGISIGDLSPTLSGFLGAVPLLLFSYVGFESIASASGEMHNPQKDMPLSLLFSGIVSALCYLLPILTMLLVMPLDTISGVSGLMHAVKIVFSVYGPASDIMLLIAAIMFVVILASQGAAWMIIGDRMQALTAADGAFFGGFFGKFHVGLGTPMHVNLLSGAIAVIFMVAAMQLTGTVNALFSVVLIISISTFLMSYLFIVPAAVKLRFTYAHIERPYKVPVSNWIFAVLGAITFAWVLLGSWVAVFPGTLEYFLGYTYNFEDIWGVSQTSFEILALSTLAVLFGIAVAGYVRGKPIREGVPDKRARSSKGDFRRVS